MLAPSVVFVDLETTGAHPVHDRVIEIGIVKVSGGRLDYEWHSLVNPGAPIPPAIQGFTGITDDMLRAAPSFADIAAEVFQRLDGSLFVAHNARFDYGFLRNEFRRLAMDFQATVLCTVKLSRALYPEHHRHGLDALIARHGLVCAARHRALGDARVLWDFVQYVHAEKPAHAIAAAVAKACRQPQLPAGLDPDLIDALPDAPGVYTLYGADDIPLHVGRAGNLRNQVHAQLTGQRHARLAQDVKRIDWIETAGELGALLTELRLVRQLQPRHNRRQAAPGDWCSLRLGEAGQAGAALELVDAVGIEADQVASLYGAFRSRREAHKALREIAAAHQLCPRRLGLDPGQGACDQYRLRRCRGACAGRESTQHHDLRLRAALATLKLKPWPYGERIGVREHNPYTGRTELHLLQSWCHLATVSDEADLHEAARARFDAAFDPDVYRLLIRYFSQHRPPVVRL